MIEEASVREYREQLPYLEVEEIRDAGRFFPPSPRTPLLLLREKLPPAPNYGSDE
jgi:hypothetical protein